jgi:hypothetical protein
MVSKQGTGCRRRALNERRPRLGGSGALSKEAAIGGIIGFGYQTRKTGKGSNNNAAQAEYDRSAALRYLLKSLKSSSHWLVFARRPQVQRLCWLV